MLATYLPDNLLLEGDLGTKVTKLGYQQKGQAPGHRPQCWVSSGTAQLGLQPHDLSATQLPVSLSGVRPA